MIDHKTIDILRDQHMLSRDWKATHEQDFFTFGRAFGRAFGHASCSSRCSCYHQLLLPDR